MINTSGRLKIRGLHVSKRKSHSKHRKELTELENQSEILKVQKLKLTHGLHIYNVVLNVLLACKLI